MRAHPWQRPVRALPPAPRRRSARSGMRESYPRRFPAAAASSASGFVPARTLKQTESSLAPGFGVSRIFPSAPARRCSGTGFASAARTP
jgi:hypothetical protein